MSVLWAYMDYDPSSVVSCGISQRWTHRNPYTPTIQILLE
jgi:hypothetical protein